MYTRSTLMGIAKSSGWNEEWGVRNAPLFLPVSVVHDLDAAHEMRVYAEEYCKLRLGVPFDVLRSMIEPSRNLFNVSMQYIEEQEQQEEGVQEQEQKQKVNTPTPDAGGGGGTRSKPMPAPYSPSKSERVAAEKAKGESKGGGEGKGKGDSGEKPLETTPEWQKWQDFRDKEQKHERMLGSLFSGKARHGSYAGEANKQSVGDRKLAERMRSSLDKLIGSFDMTITPLWHTRKLVTRYISHRSLDSSRKEEEGRPTILFLSDVSGSCRDMSEMITHVANSACLLGTINADIFSLPVGDWVYQINVFREEENLSYHNGEPLQFSVKDSAMSKMLDGYAGDIDAYVRLGMPPEVAKRYVGTEWGGMVLRSLALAKEMGRPFNLHSKMFDYSRAAGFVRENARRYDPFGKLLSSNNPIVGYMKQMANSLVVPAFQTEEQEAETVERSRQAFVELSEQLIKATGSSKRLIEKDFDDYHFREWGVSKEERHFELNIPIQIDADIIIYYTDTDGHTLIRTMLPQLKEHQRLYVLTYQGVPGIMNSEGYFRIPSRDPRFTDGIAEMGNYGCPIQVTDFIKSGERKTTGISFPNVAFRPERAYDFQYIPAWVGVDSSDAIGEWGSLACVPGAEKMTVIPNISTVEGYLWAIETIVSPDRMASALRAGKSIITQLYDAGWATHNPLANPSSKTLS